MSGFAGLVKEVLLCETGERAEVMFGELLELGQGDRLVLEVKFAERTGDPDIDGEGPGLVTGKEQGTIGDFGADSGERSQGAPCDGEWKRAE